MQTSKRAVIEDHQQRTTNDSLSDAITTAQRLIHSIISLQLCPLVASSLGPCGNTNLLIKYDQQLATTSQQQQQQDYKIPHLNMSKDGFTILQNIVISHPIGALLTRLTRTVQTVAGDGTSSAVCLVGSLMNEAYNLIHNDGIHPNSIGRCYQELVKLCVQRIKTKYAVHILKTEIDSGSINMDTRIHIDEKYLLELARSTLITRIDPNLVSEFAEICVKATRQIYEGRTIKEMKQQQQQQQLSPDGFISYSIDIVTKHDIDTWAEFVDGVVLDQGARDQIMSKDLTDCSVLFIQEDLELTQRSATQNMDMQFHTAKQRVELVNAERKLIDRKVEMIISSGAKLVISSHAIDALSLHMLAQHGITALRHVNQASFEKLVLCSGATIIHNILKQLSVVDQSVKESCMGHIGQVSIEDYQSGAYTFLTGLRGTCSTIVLSAPTKYVIESTRKALKNTCRVLQNAYEDCVIVPGGGSVDMALASYVRSLNTSPTFNNFVSQRIIESFANALEHSIPGNLCKNSGFNVYQTLSEWRQRVLERQAGDDAGLVAIDLYKYPIQFYDPSSAGLWDSLRVKIQALYQSVDMVATLLSIDHFVRAEDLRSHASNSITSTNSQDVMQTPVNSEQDTKKAAWNYRRYTPRINKELNWSREEKEAFKKREAKFYSKKETARRNKIEAMQSRRVPFQDNVSMSRERSQELERRKREMGIQGYNIDPFE